MQASPWPRFTTRDLFTEFYHLHAGFWPDTFTNTLTYHILFQYREGCIGQSYLHISHGAHALAPQLKSNATDLTGLHDLPTPASQISLPPPKA